MWPLCALFFILLQFYVPFYVKKEKIDSRMGGCEEVPTPVR